MLPPLRGAHPGREADRRGRDSSRLRLPRGEPGLRRRGRGGRARLGRAARGRARAPAATSSRRSGSRARPACRSSSEGEPGELGFPLLVKAAAGGGGRGMRVVREAGELEEALAAARREAKAAFGDDARLLRALRRAAAPRRDPAARRRARRASSRSASASARSSGATRRCSRSRPHRRSTSSCAARDERGRRRVRARAIGYRSAGTAEFMLDGRDFFFLELNGRIQVEHPVTELVTGVDLVREQLRIAAGEPLRPEPCVPQGTRSRSGSTRRIRARSCRRPGASSGCGCPDGIRVDAGVEEGDEIGTRLRPADRQADRARGDARGGARATRRRARRRPRSRASSPTCRSCAGWSPTPPFAPARRPPRS